MNSTEYIKYSEQDIFRLVHQAISDLIVHDLSSVETLREKLCLLLDEKLQAHSKYRHVGFYSVFKCKQCKFGSFSEVELKSHMRAHDHVLNCMHCNYTATDTTALERHSLLHTALTPHTCETCLYLTCSDVNLSEHKRLIHSTEFPFECDQCGFCTNGGDYVTMMHEQFHSLRPSAHVSEDTPPTTVSKSGTQKRSRKRRYQSPELVDEIKHEVSEGHSVDSLLLSNSSFVDNGRASSVDEQDAEKRPWWDTSLQVNFIAPADLTQEIGDVPEVQCSYCGEFHPSDKEHSCKVNKPRSNRSILATKPIAESFCKSDLSDKNDTDLSQPLSVDISEISTDVGDAKTSEQESHMCDTCGLTYSTKVQLARHMAKHTQTMKYKCDRCDYATHQSGRITVHMRSHTGYRPFVCSFCGKAFTTNSELRKHEKRHKGTLERKYVCDVCQKSYTALPHLRVHKRSHTGDRPFKCDQCDYAATSKTVLLNHMSVHTGEKKFKCQICGFTCAASGTLSNHKRLKHNIVNKRKTLADTVPEFLAERAEVEPSGTALM